MRRGGGLPSPRPRALAATRQAPPFLLGEEQVSALAGWGAEGGSPGSQRICCVRAGQRRGRTAVRVSPSLGLGIGKRGFCVAPLGASRFRLASFTPGP